MNKKMTSCLLAFNCICFFASVHHLFAASCPNSDRYAIIYYNHQLLNQYVSTGGTYSQASSLSGPLGIKIGPSRITNAGNNLLQRTIEVVVTEPSCDCLGNAESLVTVTVSGSCASGVLNMQIHEVYPDTKSTGTCECPGDDPPVKPFSYPIPGTLNDFTLNMNYVNGNTAVQPYSCPTGCSGTYSWQLQFTDEPPPLQEVPLVPLVPNLYLLLHQANQ